MESCFLSTDRLEKFFLRELCCCFLLKISALFCEFYYF